MRREEAEMPGIVALQSWGGRGAKERNGIEGGFSF